MFYMALQRTPQGEQLYHIILKTLHKYRSYVLDKLILWPFYHLTFKCDNDLQPARTNVSTGTSTYQGGQLCEIILKSMHKCTSYGPDMLNLWSCYQLTFKCDHDLQPTSTNISNDTFTPPGEQLCQIILKSIYKYISYSADKLDFWPFYQLTLKFAIDLQPSSTNLSNGTFTPQGKQLCQIIFKPIYKYRSYDPDNSIYDHFIIWPSSEILTFNLPNKCFKWHFCSSSATTVPNYFEIHA